MTHGRPCGTKPVVVCIECRRVRGRLVRHARSCRHSLWIRFWHWLF